MRGWVIGARTRAVVFAAGVLYVALAGVASGADRQREIQARQAYASGHYDQALELFAKLYAETLHPVYLRNIGRCHQRMREPQKAIDAFTDYLAKEKKMPADERAEIQGYINEMEALKAEQAKQSAPPVVPVTPIPPPVTAPPPTVTPVPPPPAVPPGPPPSAMLVSQPSPPPSSQGAIYTKWWFWTAVGVVVVGGVVAAVVLSGGTVRPSCPTRCM